MKEQHDLERTKYFALAFCGAFVVLSLFAMGMALSLRSRAQTGPGAAPEAGAADDYYLPRAADDLNVLLIGREREDSPAQWFFLVRLDAQRGTIPVAAFPAETAAEYGGKPGTLAELDRRDGALAVKEAVSGLLGVPVDRYVSFTGEALVKAVDILGPIEYSLPRPLQYQGEGYVIDLAMGRQQIDGRKFYDLLRYPGYGGAQAQGDFLSGLLASYIDGRLETVLAPRADEAFQVIVGLADTDLSFADYDGRREVLHFLAKLSGGHAQAVSVRGSWNAAGNSFTLSPDSLALLRTRFTAPADAVPADSTPADSGPMDGEPVPAQAMGGGKKGRPGN